MVKYRPHRGALCDAMAKMRIFDSVEDMFALDECEKRFLTHRSVLECVRLNRRTEIIHDDCK